MNYLAFESKTSFPKFYDIRNNRIIPGNGDSLLSSIVCYKTNDQFLYTPWFWLIIVMSIFVTLAITLVVMVLVRKRVSFFSLQ